MEPARRPLFFLHVPNCGGTSFVSYFDGVLGHRRHGGLWENHNLPGHAGDSWQRAWPALRSRSSAHSRTPRLSSCEEVKQWVDERAIRFFATEAFYPFARICEQFDHVLLICEPLQRLYSRAFRLRDPDKTVNALLQATVIDDPRPGHTMASRVMPSFSGTPSFSNPIVRQILGADAYRLPPGGVTAAHFEAAIARLRWVRGWNARASQP